jgi:hypothetical protein
MFIPHKIYGFMGFERNSIPKECARKKSSLIKGYVAAMTKFLAANSSREAVVR